MSDIKITIQDIYNAHNRIKSYIHKTPVFTSNSLNSMFSSLLFFKGENFQKVGAFKFRGACNAVFSLHESEAKKGVVTHSSGNHAAALSLAAKLRSIPAYIVMPDNAPKIKVDAVKSYGGRITFCEATPSAREKMAEKVLEETGGILVHPFNNWDVIAGQSTAGLELVTEVPDLDTVLVPLGGGGLLSGTLLSVKAINPSAKVYGCEPRGADDAFRSLKAGEIIPSTDPKTLADGLRTSLGDKTFEIIKSMVDDILVVDDSSIIGAMRLMFERMKIVVEPSGAIGLSAVMENRELFRNKRIGIIISGGNIDMSNFFNSLN